MSTRACYSFKDAHQTFHVYKHSDGYPSGAAQWIAAAIPLAWELPRFEASDFGAAFVAANKHRGGSVYLMPSGAIKDVAPAGIRYRYEIEAVGEQLVVSAFRTSYWPQDQRVEERIWNGPISSMAEWAENEP